MATVRFVTPAHAAILREYLGSDDGGQIVLIMPQMQELVMNNGIEDGDDVDYDHGNEPDLTIDIVASKEHYFLSEIKRA